MAKTLEAGKLIVGAIAVSIDPTGTAATALGIDAALTFKNWLTGAPDLTKLSRELTAKFQTELKSPRYDKPSDARTLLPQMLEHAFPSGAQIADCGLDAEQILKAMHKTLATKDSEYSKHEIVTAFDNLLLPLLAAACNDPRLVAVLSPQLTRKQMADQSETKDDVKETKDDVKELKTMMAQLLGGAAISLDNMKTLAAKFGEHDISDQASLEQFLKKKADEYRALKSEVDQIDAGLKRLSNLKAAAQDAIANVNLDEVETLLARVQEVELDEAAKTAELRATNALLRGKTDQAHALLSAAAGSFAAIDPLEPARRKILQYFAILYNHGLRYGGTALGLAQSMLEKTLTDELQDQDGGLWAAGQNNLGGALQNQGTRTSGADGNALLADAVTAYRSALRVRTETDHPVDWVMTQNNLGAALAEQGTRISGTEGNTLLGEAVTAYRSALRITTETAHPVHWAMTQENLAQAEQALAHHDSTANPRPHLTAALAHVDSALTVYDPAHMPYNHGTASGLRDNILADLADLDPA